MASFHVFTPTVLSRKQLDRRPEHAKGAAVSPALAAIPTAPWQIVPRTSIWKTVRNHEHRQARSIGAAVLRSVNVVWLAPRSEARSPAPHLYGPGYGSNARSIRGLILCTARAAPHAFVNPPIPRQSFRAIDSDMIPC